MRANTSVKARSSSTGSAVSASLSAIADRLTVSAAPARTPARPTSKNFAFCVISLHPKEGINRTALVPHFKIQAGVGLAAAVADRRNRVAGLDPFAHLLIQTFIIAVQAHIAFTMIDNDEVAKTAQPLGKHHLAGGDRLHRRAWCSANEQAFPVEATALPRSPEAVHQFPRDRQAQRTFQA